MLCQQPLDFPGPNSYHISPNDRRILDVGMKYLQDNETLSATANAIAEPIEEAWVTGKCDGKGSAEGQLWSLWRCLLIFAKNINYQGDELSHGLLINLFQALKERPEPKIPSSVYAQVKDHFLWQGAPLWNSLVLYGPASREESDDWHPSRFSDSERQVSLQEWLNLQAFMARMTGAEVDDHWMLGIMAFRCGLEDEDEWCTEPAPTRQDVDVEVPAAAVWITYAGSWVYNRAKEGSELREEASDSGKSKKGRWEGPFKKLNLARWNLWKQCFNDIANLYTDVEEGSKQMATKAYEIMAKVESREENRPSLRI